MTGVKNNFDDDNIDDIKDSDGGETGGLNDNDSDGGVKDGDGENGTPV